MGTYEGDFVNGVKHGDGHFNFVSNLKYVGEYKNGIREGKGKIINKNGSIAYDGEFKNNMPNGKGVAPTKSGELKEKLWVDGIDKDLLE